MLVQFVSHPNDYGEVYVHITHTGLRCTLQVRVTYIYGCTNTILICGIYLHVYLHTPEWQTYKTTTTKLI